MSTNDANDPLPPHELSRIQPASDDAPAAPVTLELAELVEDVNGEIVLFNDSHLPALAIHAARPPVAQGEVDHHVTASGDDVSGFHYIAFADGPTLFYQHGLDLVVLTDPPG